MSPDTEPAPIPTLGSVEHHHQGAKNPPDLVPAYLKTLIACEHHFGYTRGWFPGDACTSWPTGRVVEVSFAMKPSKPNSKVPTSCIEDNPNRRTTFFAGKFISQSCIARSENIDQSHLSRIARALFNVERYPSMKEARLIASALGMGLGFFVDALEEHMRPGGAHKKIGMKASSISCIEKNPNKRTISFAGRYINQSALARSTHIDPSLISRIFKSERPPTWREARRIASALDMGLGDFVEAWDEKRREFAGT